MRQSRPAISPACRSTLSIKFFLIEPMSRVKPPPRLLIGATLLFWGAMSGRPVVGLLMALVAESHHWLRWRWDFDDTAISRAWQLALMLCVGLMVLLLIDGEREQLMPILITWLPALLLPLQLAQMFGLRTSVPLSAFSFFAARRRERNKRLGIEEPEVLFHFGNAYFVIMLISAALGVLAEGRLFLPGLLVLCAWRFLVLPGRRSGAILTVFFFTGLMALLGQATLNRMYDWFSRGGHGSANWMSDATHGYTSIGSMRDLKLSSDIRWRLRVAPGEPSPKLLRRAAFNLFRGSNWEIPRSSQGGADAQFADLDTIEPAAGEAYYIANPQIDTAQAASDDLARFTMRGSLTPGAAMPLPGSIASFRDFNLDAAQRNPLSTVRAFPAEPVIDGMVLWQADRDPDGEPLWTDDLRIPPLENQMIRRVSASIGLEEGMTTGEKMARIKNWFQRDFNYTLYLSMRLPTHPISEGTAIGRFLETSREGHCEYFATSAALLLRSVNVPTRYTTGYAVVEKDQRRNEWIIRGIHGHAWCRVWVAEEQRWVDFDPTPSDWQALEQLSKISWSQRFFDALKRLREDIFIWRSDPENRELLFTIIAIPGVIGGFWIVWRLWRSRHRSARSAWRQSRGSGLPSALLKLEAAATRRLGPRPDGTPFGRWLSPLAEQCGDAADALHEAIRLHQKLRFDPGFHDEDASRRLEDITRILRKSIGGKNS